MPLPKKHHRPQGEPPLIEPVKPCVFARGLKCSQVCKEAMTDLAKLKNDSAKLTTGKNDVRPMEDEPGVENLCNTFGAGLFVFAQENKKRPHNMVFGRVFDRKLLDMVEVGVTMFESMKDCQKRSKTTAASCYHAPLLFFKGEEFANANENSDLATFQSLLIDMFHGKPVKEIDLEAIDLALVFTSLPDGTVQMRGFRVAFAKHPAEAGEQIVVENENKAPFVELVEHGPNIDFEIRRSRIASANLAKLARRTPKLPGSGNTKNVSNDPLRGLVGQIHMHKQDTNKLVTRSRFSKILKRKAGDKKDKKENKKENNGKKKQRVNKD